QLHGTPDLRLLEAAALDHEAQMNAGEHLGILLGTLGLEEGLAAFHRLSGFSEDAHHVETGTAAQAQQQQLHRAHAQVATAAFRCAIHHHHMPAAGFAEKHGLTGPLDTRFHSSRSLHWKERAAYHSAGAAPGGDNVTGAPQTLRKASRDLA